MAWEDEINATVATRDQNAFDGPATENQYAQMAYAQARLAPTTARAYQGERPWPDPPGVPIGNIHRCGRDQHYFECKHELRCECGLTERLPLQLPEGM